MRQENELGVGTHVVVRCGATGGCGAGAGTGSAGCVGVGPAATLVLAGAHAATASSTPASIPARALNDPPELGVSITDNSFASQWPATRSLSQSSTNS